MSKYNGFVRGGEQTADVAEQQQAIGTGVVILAPKQAAKLSEDLDARPSSILNIRRALQKSTGGRAASPASPAAGRRRASPTYEAFGPRGSPTYEPLTSRRSPGCKVQDTAAGSELLAGQQAAGTRRSKSRSRSRSGSRNRSRRRHRRRSSSTEDRKRKRHSRSSSRPRQKHKYRSTHDRTSSKRHKHSRSHSHSRSRSSRRRSNRRDTSRSRERSYKQYNSRHSSRSGGRQRSLSPVPFSRQEKSRAWKEQRAYTTHNPVRRGKQGLGFGQQQQQQSEDEKYATSAAGSADRHRSSRETAAAVGGNSSRSVSTLDAAALIPGYASMTASEKLKARMRLVMSKAEQQGAGVDRGASAAGLGSHGLGPSDAGVIEDVTNNGWTRFVFDRHGELDEDKQARQKLMDAEVGQVAMGGFGNAADDTLDTSAAFIMGTGRVAAQRAGWAQAAEAAHDDAIFGRPYGGSAAAGPSSQGLGSTSKHTDHQLQHIEEYAGSGPVSEPQPEISISGSPSHVIEDAKQLAASLGVSEALVVEQQKPGASWRDRAMAMRAKRQQ